MNKPLTMALAIAVIATGIGVLNPDNFIQTISGQQQVSEPTLQSKAPVLGHITAIATDQNGKIIAYRQTDNTITQAGENCILQNEFSVTSGASGCSHVTQKYNVIAIGTGQSSCGSQPARTVTALTTEKTRANATTIAMTAAGASGGQVVLTQSFTTPGSGTYNEAGVFDSAVSAGSDQLAQQCFSGITLGANDNLQISWTFTLP